MYGRQCYGFTVDQFTSVGTAILRVIRQLLDRATIDDDVDVPEMIEVLSECGCNQDSFGLGTIIYFQNLRVPENWEDEDEEDEESEEDDE